VKDTIRLLVAFLLLPLLILFNSLKGAAIATSQGIVVATLLWIFLFPVMVIISVVIGIGLTIKQFREYSESEELE
jgi:hypothetical protein